ncbi:hypothetical protein [Devosia sp. 2618]|uniref:hypothetical protein n=1 Tax=Devosia sp. 2618 TaxID=3156454 RepID=UPI0033972C96
MGLIGQWMRVRISARNQHRAGLPSRIKYKIRTRTQSNGNPNDAEILYRSHAPATRVIDVIQCGFRRGTVQNNIFMACCRCQHDSCVDVKRPIRFHPNLVLLLQDNDDHIWEIEDVYRTAGMGRVAAVAQPRRNGSFWHFERRAGMTEMGSTAAARDVAIIVSLSAVLANGEILWITV